MAFLSICPRDKKYLEYKLGDIPLKVVQSDGVEKIPDFNVQETELNGGYSHFKVRSGRADKFKVTVIIHKNDKVIGHYVHNQLKTTINITNVNVQNTVLHSEWGDYDIFEGHYLESDEYLDVRKLLDYFMRHLTPLLVTSDIIGVGKGGVYIISGNDSRKQDYYNYTKWDLVFTRYFEVTYPKFKKTTKGIEKAMKKLKSKTTAKVSATTKLRKALAKCKPKVLVYSKKKKSVDCVKTLQKLLNKKLGTKLKIDGWFNKETKKAVVKYQDKYAKKYGLKKSGKIDTKTYNVMIGKGKVVKNVKVSSKSNKKTTKKSSKPTQIGKTIIIKSDTGGILK